LWPGDRRDLRRHYVRQFGEINSLATVTVIDLYQRHFKRNASDRHYLWASRWFTLFWGVYAVVFAGWAKRLGSLIVAVNKWVRCSTARCSAASCWRFYSRRCEARRCSCGMLAGEAAIFTTAAFTDVSWLWYNVIGCAVVVAVGWE